MTETKGNDGTDRAERKELDPTGKGFTFDSEVMLEVAASFDSLRAPLERASKLIKENQAEITAGYEKVEPYLAYVRLPERRLPMDYAEAVTKAGTATDKVGNATDYTARSLRKSGEMYYERDRSAYMRWKKMGNDVDDLRDREDLLDLKYPPEG